MTDDFNLFDDPNDGDRPIDPDLALVSAYLARELSPMQVLALEERLATDPEFRAAMQPLFDLWAMPVASLESGAARRIAPLTPTEADAHWQRFLGEVPASGAAEQFTRRRIPMKRIAAVIAVTTLPMVTFAQVVLHAANNADAPGHTIARRIVAPFVAETPAPQPRAQTPRRPQRKTPVAPVPAPETTAVAPVQMSELTVAAPAQRAQPDRAKIAGLARQYQPAVVRGETDATYIVMVLDASENYLWSTAGIGNVSIEVGGDTRTPAERSAYTREYRGELTGRAADAGAVGRGGRGGGAGGAIATPVDTATAKRAILRMQGGAARGGGGGRGGIVIGDSLHWDSVQFKVKAVEYGLRQKPGYDSAYWVRFDSMKPGAVFARSGRGGRGGTLDTTGAVVYRFELEQARSAARGGGAGGAVGAGGGGRGGRGGGVADSTLATRLEQQSTLYRQGWFGSRYDGAINQAPGLGEPVNGQSGIEGLPSASVAMAENYTFPEGELAPKMLRVMVVHLTPGTRWSGR